MDANDLSLLGTDLAEVGTDLAEVGTNLAEVGTDTIYRQAAIDAIGEVHPLDYNAQAIKSRIENLPSAQPEQNWIPCSEQLPEEDEDVLVCTEPYGQIRKMYVAWRHGEQVGKSGFYEPKWNSNSAENLEGCKVIAWMPLPEPYKEVEHE